MLRKDFSTDRRGVSATETALVLPIFLLLLMGIVEFGRAFSINQLLTTAAREGARVAVLSGTTNNDVQQTILDFVEGAVGIAPQDVSVTILVTPAPGNPDAGNEVGNANPKDDCEVTVTLLYDKVTYVPASYLGGMSLTGHCIMRHE